MGNKHSFSENAHVSGENEATEAKLRQKCEASTMKSFEVISGCKKSEGQAVKEVVDLADLTAYVGLQYTELSKGVFEHMSEGSDCVTRDRFVQLGADILQSSDDTLVTNLILRCFSDVSDKLGRIGCQNLLEDCAAADMEIILSCIPVKLTDMHDIMESLLKSLYGSEETISHSDLLSWVRHCPSLLSGIVTITKAVFSRELKEKLKHEQKEKLVLNQEIMDGHHLLSLPICWPLAGTLHSIYFHAQCAAKANATSSTNLGSLLASGCWHCLYDSNEHGLSFNRFTHHVLAYKGPTFLLIAFENYIYGLGADQEWKNSGSKWGGADSCLVQIMPQYKLMMSGENMIFFNTENRKMPKGIFIGKDSKTIMLQTDEGLSKVKYYGLDIRIDRIEVWGCGGQAALEQQRLQRDWEKQDTEKHRQRKLKLEDWKDNPDKQLLEMGGITTEHAQR